MPQLGQGVLKGMGITLKHLFDNKVTRQYPEYKKETFERSRGLLTVDMDRCIACLQCMRICPDHCISIEQEKRDADGSGKAKPYAVGFVIDDSRCMYCSLALRSARQLHLPHRGVRSSGLQRLDCTQFGGGRDPRWTQARRQKKKKPAKNAPDRRSRAATVQRAVTERMKRLDRRVRPFSLR